MSDAWVTPKLERRTLIIDRAPPRRLAPGARWRSFKRGPDAIVWESAISPLEALESEGWQVQRATVDWGKSRPVIEDSAMQRWLQDMTHSPQAVHTVWSGQGRGQTVLELARER